MSTDLLANAKGLCKEYKATSDGGSSVSALSGVNVQVAAGEMVVLRGPSGCGKTTLLLVLGLLMRPDAGELTLLGTKPTQLDANARAQFRSKHLGFVFQEANLIPYLDVQRNILAPTLAAPMPEVEARVASLLHILDMAKRSAHKPSQLSGGERQRVALARAVIGNPELVLADEPTGNLDETNATIVMNFLRDYAKEQGRGVVVASHDDRVAALGDRVITMKGGVMTSAS